MASTQTEIDCAGTTYKHQPLDPEKHQIRLLKKRDSSEHTIDYSLTTFDFEDAPTYVALSYTWGDERPTGFVRIDGQNYEIRINLFNFLRTYEMEDFTWIDQISIDQLNLEERSHQVRLMWKIYSQCSFVLVWLRNEPTGSRSTHQAALDFNERTDDPDEIYVSRLNQEDPEWPILALLRNSYFERLWIVQELLLSRDIRLLVEGNVWVSWKSLQRKTLLPGAATRLLSILHTYWLMSSQYFRFVDADILTKDLSHSVTQCVYMYCDQKCEDPRDKVYGLMALVEPSSQVEIDYTKSAHQVFLDAIMSMIREYWNTRHESPGDGHQERSWHDGVSLQASQRLANAMQFTDPETSGLRSFVDCVWERILRHEVTTNLPDYETHCITSLGYEPKTRQESSNGRLAATCDRWWYEFQGIRYYHDCKEWSGAAELQDYTESLEGLRDYGSAANSGTKPKVVDSTTTT